MSKHVDKDRNMSEEQPDDSSRKNVMEQPIEPTPNAEQGQDDYEKIKNGESINTVGEILEIKLSDDIIERLNASIIDQYSKKYKGLSREECLRRYKKDQAIENATYKRQELRFNGFIKLELCDYDKGQGILKIDLANNTYMSPIQSYFSYGEIVNPANDYPNSFPFTLDDVERLYKWLESQVIPADEPTQEFILGKEKTLGDDFVLGLMHMKGNYDSTRESSWKKKTKIPIDDCCFAYIYNETKDKVVNGDYFRTDTIVRMLYNTLRDSTEPRLKSPALESYFQAQEIHLEYKGYTCTTSLSNYKDNKILSPEGEVLNCGFYGDTYEELKGRFEWMVISDINKSNWRKRNEEWKTSDIDKESIGCVFDIMPDKFKQRVETGLYDKSLNDKVEKGLYEVPLYYVTKAWDILLKGDLSPYEFWVEIDDDDDDDYECDDDCECEYEKRTLEEAIDDNDEMKRLWKELMDIDIDALEVDFRQFDRHLPPNVKNSQMEAYFDEPWDGISEWILGGINSPNGQVSFDHVSSLMEFAAYMLYIRDGHHYSY